MQPLAIPRDSYKRATWKNGLGWTDEIAIFPTAADLRRGDFLWRLSSARIERSSPFSVFAEHDRILIVLEGEGVRLSHTFVEGEAPELTELPPLEPYEFPGDVATSCDLLSGPIQDFSIFLRKGLAQAETEILELDAEAPSEWSPRGRTSFLYLIQGKIEVLAEGGPILLQAGDTLRRDGAASDSMQLRALEGESRAVSVHLNY